MKKLIDWININVPPFKRGAWADKMSLRKEFVIGTSREEAEKLIEGHLERGGGRDGNGKTNHWKEGEWDKLPHHYGRCELKDLLDLIYGKEKE